MKKVKKFLSLILVVLLPFQSFNAIAMDNKNPEEFESTNKIRAKNHSSTLATTYEEETDGDTRRPQVAHQANFILNVTLATVTILFGIVKIFRVLFPL